jgi:hypothetical protein
MRIVLMAVLGSVLAALSLSPCRAADAVPSGNAGTLSLGSNWGAYESYHGAAFRWVDNDAEIVLHGGAGEAHIAIACEGGPSLGRRTFALRVLDGSHRQVDHVVCDGPDRRPELLLPAGNGETRYVLHADGGGKKVPGDPRILNFRVFSLDDGRGGQGGDVVDPRSGVRVGDGWFPLERYKGQTFRWMENDGRLYVSSDRPAHATLRLLLEVGPSVGAREARVTVRDRRGRTLVQTTLNGRGVVSVPMELERGDNEVVVGVQSRNARVPNERRILNLRLFSASVQR